MTALIIAWHDKDRGDYRALVDTIDADGGRHPYTAARANDSTTLGNSVNAILADMDPKPSDVQTFNLGVVEHKPSFLTVRSLALVKEAAAI